MATSLDLCVRREFTPPPPPPSPKKLVNPGRYQATVTAIVDRATLVNRYKNCKEQFPLSIAEVVFLITAGAFAGETIKWPIRLEDASHPNDKPFTAPQQERAQNLLNEFLDSCDRDTLAECLGAHCVIKLKHFLSKEGIIAYFDGSSYLKKRDLDLESDRDFLAGK